ncbi:hypothetical protein A1D31_14110 [Bradyrhizobium liaoningense]|nr:hypothetical protein A1D31_14110 [Bradyrhizobium liaoningense]
MKRYAVFAGDNHYPVGGWNDFKGSFATKAEAIAFAEKERHEYSWAHVIDLQTGEEVFSR